MFIYTTQKNSPFLFVFLSNGKSWKLRCVAVAIKLVEKIGARPQLRGRYLGANYRRVHTFEKRVRNWAPEKSMETRHHT